MSEREHWYQAFGVGSERYYSSPALQTSLLWVLALSVENKLPLVPMLDAFADDAPRAWRPGVRQLASRIHSGMSLPDALQETPGVISPEAVLAARVGAESGVLATVLRSSAASGSARQQLRPMELPRTLVYLMALCTVLFSITGFIMYWIIPKFLMIFRDFGTQLPAVTQLAIDVSTASVDYGLVLVPLLVVAALLWPRFVALVTGRPPRRSWRLDPVALATRLSPRSMVTDVLRSLATTTAAGRPLSSAIATLSRHHYSGRVCRKLARVERDLEAGVSCWDSLVAVGLLRRADAAVLSAAERTGNLPWALGILADRRERRLTARILALSELVQPAVVVCLGIVVGFYVIAFFMPLVKLIHDFS